MRRPPVEAGGARGLSHARTPHTHDRAPSLATSVLSGSLGRIHHHGRAIAVAIAAWGASISAFGLVLALAPPPAPSPGGTEQGLPWAPPWLWGALATLAAAGAADAVSAVYRQSVLQSASPDASRGLLAGVFIVVVAGGPRLGEAVSGVLAARVGEAVVPLAGGLVCIALVAALVARHRSFWAYDARHPVP